MGVQNPRVALTVPKSLNSVLDEISDLQGIPKSKVILNILLEMEPQLNYFREALLAAKNGKNPNAILNNMLSDAFIQLGHTFKANKND